MKKKFLSLFLTLALLLSLTGCGSSGVETTPPTTTAPTATTEPAPDPVEVYNTAAEKVRSAPSVLIDYTIEKEMTVGSDTYLETEKTILSLTGIGTDGFAAKADTTYTWGEDYYADARDIYIDGVLYGTMDDLTFSGEMSAKDFQSSYLPTVLLTAELYENVQMQDNGTLSFSGATGLEPWLDREDCELVEASGTAYIDESGELEDCTYDVCYTCGGVLFHLSITSRAMTGSITVEAPADPSIYVATDFPEAPFLYERAIGLVLQACDVTSTSSENILFEAGGVLLSQQSTMNSHGSGEDLLARFDSSVSLTDLSTGISQYSITQEETYRDGVYTIRIDDGSAEEDPGVDSELMREACRFFVADMMHLLDDLENITVTDTGVAYLLEYTVKEEIARQYTTTLCGAVYEDAELLDNLATDYRTDTACGYVGIDRITGLPLSLGEEYLGIHTIEGTQCRLAYDHSQSVSIGTGASYEEITGVPLSAEEPQTPATPLLYHVTDENGGEMWLFGTIHVGDERTAYLPQYIQDAFNAADALAVEFDSNAFDQQVENDEELIAQIQQYYFYTDGTATSDHITDQELYDAAVQILKATGGYHINVEIMKPILLANTIENTYLDLGHALSGVYGVDNRLMLMAQEQDKQILSVESGIFQIRMLTGFSDPLQEQLLLEAVASNPREYQESTLELFEMWCAGDEAALIAYLNEDVNLSEMTEEEIALYEEYWNAMSTDRNAEMLGVAKEYLSGGQTVFYAVGLAHLLAEDGLVNTLRDSGYTVELVSGS